jgi:ELWxxDGT repeat protein
MDSVRLTTASLGGSPGAFVPFNSSLYFLASGQLYVTDGTAAGTADITGASLINPYDLTASGNHLFFASGYDVELWVSDGTAAGTYQLKDISPGSGSSGHSSPDDLISMDNILYFSAQDTPFNSYRSLWRSNGTPSGTFAVAENVLLRSPMPGDFGDDDLVVSNSALYFPGASPAYGRELWMSDGTSAGTRMIKDINPATSGNLSSDPRWITPFHGGVYFGAFTQPSGLELWTSDGTDKGTRQVSDFNPGPGDGLVVPSTKTDPVPIFGGGDSLFLVANDGLTGVELWQTGGTPDTTVRVTDLEPGDQSSNPRQLGFSSSADGSSVVLFAADSLSNGRELWSAPTAPPTRTAPQWLWVNPGATWTFVSEDLKVNSGTVALIRNPEDSGSTITMEIAAGASATFDVSQHLGALSIAGSATITAGGDKVLVVDSLSFASGGSLDLADNDLVVHNGNLGTWNGSAYGGMTGVLAEGSVDSSSAEDRRTMLGVATAGDIFGISGSQTATFDGQTVSASDVLIKFTYAGDANLDGKINIDDYGRIDANVGQSGAVFGWYNGDFNFDGKINIDDYGLIDSVIGSQGPVLYKWHRPFPRAGPKCLSAFSQPRTSVRGRACAMMLSNHQRSAVTCRNFQYPARIFSKLQ